LSKHLLVYLNITKEFEEIIADLIHTDEDSIIIKHARIQYQIGWNGCGLFAIASALALCFGINPSEIKLKQEDMRKHLYVCLTT